jgi:tRNA threonylcarbamoyladenosine biosynthesis protein TsaB
VQRPELTLAFDTSAAQCAAALLSGGEVLAVREEAMDKGQAERLMPMISEMLAEAGRDWRDVTLVGVGIGPGNFTGVRISVAAARGLAMSLGAPAIGVTRLEALAEGLPRPLAVVEDARRGEVYAQDFGVGAAGTPRLVALGALADLLDDRPLTGSAAVMASAVTGGRVVAQDMPLALAIARIAAARAGTPQPRPAPLYLRAADAALPREAPPVLLP